MKIKPNISKFLEGGAIDAPVEDPAMNAPEDTAGQDPLMQLAQMAAQALQTQDANLAMQVCQALLEMIQAAQGGGAAPQEQPVFRKGGVLAYRIKK